MEVFKVLLLFVLLLSLTNTTPMSKLQLKKQDEKKAAVNGKLKEILKNVAKDPDKGAGEQIPAINELAGVTLVEGDEVLVELPPYTTTETDAERIKTFSQKDDESKETNADKKTNVRVMLRSKRSAVRDVRMLWRTKVIPYILDNSSLTDSVKAKIKEAIQEINSISCVKWVPGVESEYHVRFQKLSGCWSYIGKAFNPYKPTPFQNLSIGDNCDRTATIQHEMFHAMGFFHEQSRPDRGLYLVVHENNILPRQEHNFVKQSEKVADVRNTPYDFTSIMQYGNTAFSKDGTSKTMDGIRDPNKVFGNAKKLSSFDIAELNKVYDCNNQATSWSTWGNYGPCTNGKQHRWRFCSSEDLSRCPGADSVYGSQVERRDCTVQKVDGMWSSWYAWSHCTKPCGGGTRTRYRACSNPVPIGEGNNCVGSQKSTETCNTVTCPPATKICSFDVPSNWYSYSYGGSNKYRWILKTASGTSSNPAGPEGNYLYVSSENCVANEVASTILTSIQNPTPASCVEFSYMHGSGKETLSIGTFNAISGYGFIRPVSSANADSKWYKVKQTVSNGSPYRLGFFAKCVKRGNSAIAIDEIQISSGTCS